MKDQPAFPVKQPMGSDCLGMTLRDYFAAKAMQGLLANPDVKHIDFVAPTAYTMADAMMKEREK